MIRGLPGERGIFTPKRCKPRSGRSAATHHRRRLVEVEQTANKGGGACWPTTDLKAVADIAHEHGMKVHMDGARVLNAAVALGGGGKDVVADCDTVWLDFTKGLGAPLGRGAGRPARLCRPGLALEAAARRFDAPGRDERRRLYLRAATQYRSVWPRIMPTPTRWRAEWRGSRDQGGDSPGDRSGVLRYRGHRHDGSSITGKLRKTWGGGAAASRTNIRARACLHLDISAAQVDEALGVMKLAAAH